MTIIIELFLTFLRIGAFSFGGGYAMISLLQHEAVSHGWMTVTEFSDVVAISQITPGPIAVNMATFVGYRQTGIFGSLIATFGVALPSFILVILAMKFITKFKSAKIIDYIFQGLRPAVAGLIAAACVQIAWPEFFPNTEVMDFSTVLSSIEFRAIGLCAVVFVAIYKFKANPIVMIVLSAAAGILLF